MFFRSRDEAFTFALADRRGEPDLLASHEEFLGRHLADIVANCENAVDVSTCWRGLLDPAVRWRVRATMSGVAGDSGTHSPQRLLFSDGPTRESMVADESLYKTALNSREVARCASRTVLSPDPHCMTLAIGLDNR